MGTPNISEWSDMMPDTVTVDRWTGRSVSGVPTYAGSPTSYPAYIEMQNHLIVGDNGQEITARGRVYLGTTVVIGTKDKITLPSGFVPSSPPILAVNLVSDDAGSHHVVLEIG